MFRFGNNVYVLIICIVLIYKSAICEAGCRSGNCAIDGITDTHWDTEYSPKLVQDDTTRGELFKLQMTDTIKACPTLISSKYLKYECTDKNELAILTNDDIEFYDRDEVENDEAKVRLQFQCETGSCDLTITQKLYDVNTKFPKFEKSEYIFTLPMPWPQSLPLTAYEQIKVEDIDFSNRLITFEIEPNELVEVTYDTTAGNSGNPKQHSAILKPKTVIDLVDEVKFKITATDVMDKYENQNQGETTVIIRRDDSASVAPVPKFEKVHYKGRYTETDTVAMELIKIGNTGEASIKPTLEGDFKKYFGLTIEAKNLFRLNTKKALEPDVLEKFSYINLNMHGKNEKNPTEAVAVITLDLPKQEMMTTPCPTTQEPTCPTQTECPECTTTECPTVTCPSTTECPETTTGECPECPTEETCPAPTTCPTPPECPETSCEECETCEECPVTTPSPEIVTTPCSCPSTEETTTGDCEVRLHFLEPLDLSFKVDTKFTGNLVQRKAVVYPTENIIYSLRAGEISDHFTIDKSTGQVSIMKENMIHGLYKLNVDAETKDTKQKASFEIQLVVEYKPQWQNALIYMEIPEKKNQKDLIELDDDARHQGCQLSANQVFPKLENEDWFYVNKDSKNIDVSEISRKHEAFKDLGMYQVQIMVEIICDPTFDMLQNLSTSYVISKAADPKQKKPSGHFIYTDDIEQKSNILYVNIDILKVDKQPPVFVDPSPYYLGYPNSQLANIIQPAYLHQLKAIVEDEDSNTDIEYSIRTTNSIFMINRETGVIYPVKGASSELDKTTKEISIKAVATKDGLASEELDLNVLILSIDDVIIMKVDGAMLEDLPKVMESVGKATTWTVKYLGASVIPETNIEDSLFMKAIHRLYSKVDLTTQLSLYAYALDGEQVIKAEDFVKKIEENKEEIENGVWLVQSVEPQTSDPNVIIKVEKESYVGWVVAVIVLAIVVIVFICGSVAFLVKRRLFTDQQIFLETASISDDKEPTSTPPGPIRRSVNLNDNTVEDTNDEKNGDFLVVPGIPERKKSVVTFNEDVEEIQLRL